VERLTLCLALAAALAVTGPAVTGPAKAGHYWNEAGAHAGHDRNEGQTLITDARDAALGSPQTIVELDTAKLKGDPGCAWAPDSKALPSDDRARSQRRRD
jgi:hypothetical protein